MHNVFKKSIATLLILTTGMLGLPVTGLAAPIGTETLIQLDQRGQLLSRIQSELARDEVRTKFLEQGVSPAEVDARVAALSTDELQMLAAQLEELPAGGSVLGVIGAVFVVLLVLELVGVTNIFTKI